MSSVWLCRPGVSVGVRGMSSTRRPCECGEHRTLTRQDWMRNAATHIPDLLDREIRIRGNTRIAPSTTCSHINNDHHGSRAKSLEQLGDFQIRGAQARASVVETYWAFFGCRVSAYPSALSPVEFSEAGILGLEGREMKVRGQREA